MVEQIINTTQKSEITTSTARATFNINLPPLIIISAIAQLPLKLTLKNSSWRAQFNSLLLRYNLLGYFNGDTQCPEATETHNGVITPN